MIDKMILEKDKNKVKTGVYFPDSKTQKPFVYLASLLKSQLAHPLLRLDKITFRTPKITTTAKSVKTTISCQSKFIQSR